MSAPLPLIALFYNRAGDSRLEEFESVARRLGAPVVDWCWDGRVRATNDGDAGPPILQRLPQVQEAEWGWLADTAARCVGCRAVFEVWGQGDTIEACAAAAAATPPEHFRTRVQGSWRFNSVVLGASKSHRPDTLGARMSAFGPLLAALEGRPVDLNKPDHRLWLVEDRQLQEDRGPAPDGRPRYLLLFQLTARVAPIQRRMAQLALPKRAFLSTSTLPADRALLLCNLALAWAPLAHATMLDPYCGSGGILLAAAALGAQTVGSDLDWRMVSDNRWPNCIPASQSRPHRGVERVRMRDNFVEAALPQPKALLTLDVCAPDAAAKLLSANGGEPYDALVCDPPYGRREFQGGEEAWAGELAFKVDTAALGRTLHTLLRLARQTLVPTGRLVFFAPVRSTKDPSKPSITALKAMLQSEGATHGLRLIFLSVEVVHRSLHRAVVVMEREVHTPTSVASDAATPPPQTARHD